MLRVDACVLFGEICNCLVWSLVRLVTSVKLPRGFHALIFLASFWRMVCRDSRLLNDAPPSWVAQLACGVRRAGKL